VSRRAGAVAGVAVATLVAATLLATPAAAAGPAPAPTDTPFVRTPVAAPTPTALHFMVAVGPTGTQRCDVEADLRVPAGVDATHRAPAILTSNGFGGNKSSTGATASNGSYAIQYARQGYVTLSYSGLGFGNSTCQIELDSPAYDGKAAAALVDFLGGDTSRAYTTYTADPSGVTAGMWSNPYTAAPPVRLDGRRAARDPRVGMIGGSYGGENQLAAASVSPKIDTIIPQITWSDLVYALAPNNLVTTGGAAAGDVDQTAAAPGVEKFQWVSLFFGVGASQADTSTGGTQLSTCPGFDPQACAAKVQMDALGYPDASTVDFAHSASSSTYLNSIHIPVFLSQGQDDTLFNLREAATTYRRLAARGFPVKMMWQHWGHSGPAVAGEADGTSAAPALYDDLRYAAWFARYLRGDTRPATLAGIGPSFDYYADWLPTGGADGTHPSRSYLGATSFPVGADQALHLSGGDATGAGALVHDAADVVAGAASFGYSPVTTTSYSETSAVDQSGPLVDAPGTFAAFTSPPLAAAADQVGSPTLTVNLNAPVAAAAQGQPAGQLVLFAKLYDVAPDGRKTLANRLVSPVRVTDVTKPVGMHLPSAVHRYAAGHRLQLVLASGDAAYKGNDLAGPATVITDVTHVNTLSVPLTDPGGAVFTSEPAAAALPEVPLPALLPLTGLAGLAVVLRRRRRQA